MMGSFVCLRSDGRLDVWTGFVDYDFISKYVGGWVEYVSLSDECSLYVNENGKLDGLPVNYIATRIANFVNPNFTDVLAGDVVFCGKCDSDGNDGPLSSQLVSNFVECYRVLVDTERIFVDDLDWSL